jgi:oxygen-independent coproporphyrinogen III oxidase
LNRGVRLPDLERLATEQEWRQFRSTFAQLVGDGLLEELPDAIRLTSRGRLLSNEVFARFLSPSQALRG